MPTVETPPVLRRLPTSNRGVSLSEQFDLGLEPPAVGGRRDLYRGPPRGLQWPRGKEQMLRGGSFLIVSDSAQWPRVKELIRSPDSSRLQNHCRLQSDLARLRF